METPIQLDDPDLPIRIAAGGFQNTGCEFLNLSRLRRSVLTLNFCPHRSRGCGFYGSWAVENSALTHSENVRLREWSYPGFVIAWDAMNTCTLAHRP
jgi:hypothetical protein